MMTVIKVAQDLAASWEHARPGAMEAARRGAI
jgi:hypothetical protein